MNRSTVWGVPLATLLLSAAASAAEPGFYFGATASRVKHDVEGYPGIPVLNAFPTLPPVFGGIGPAPPIIIISPSPPFVLLPTSVEIDEVDAGFGAMVGYRINRYLAAELTYSDFGEYERVDRFTISAVRYQIGVRGPSVSVLGSLPLGEQWEVFLRGGVLFADQEVTTKVPLRTERDYSDEVVMAGVGVQWSFAPRWTARLEYQRTDDLKYDNTRGESRIDQASLGVLFKL